MAKVHVVNPSKPRSSAKPRKTVAIVRVSNPTMQRAANPRPRRARRTVLVMNPRRRRRNPAPMIMPNPRGRRARRRNPGLSVMAGLKTAAMGIGIAGGAYVVNRYLLGNIGYKADQHWNSADNRRGTLLRSGLRLALGTALAMFWPGAFGATALGALTYPAIGEMHAWWTYRDSGTTATETVTPTHQQLGVGLEGAGGSYLDDVLDGIILGR